MQAQGVSSLIKSMRINLADLLEPQASIITNLEKPIEIRSIFFQWLHILADKLLRGRKIKSAPLRHPCKAR